jgi:predicted nuclease of predicted toxin-antitoxin system
LRFVLDEDVPAQVRRRITSAGHDCWTVPAAGLSHESDDTVSVYADDMGAVFVTHDRGLIRRRQVEPFGRHVHLDCRQPAAADAVEAHLGAIVSKLESGATIVGVNSRGAWTIAPTQLRESKAR